MTTTPSGFNASANIEFACNQCGRLLKVDSSAAGRNAKCPQCGTIQPVQTATVPGNHDVTKNSATPGYPVSNSETIEWVPPSEPASLPTHSTPQFAPTSQETQTEDKEDTVDWPRKTETAPNTPAPSAPAFDPEQSRGPEKKETVEWVPPNPAPNAPATLPVHPASEAQTAAPTAPEPSPTAAPEPDSIVAPEAVHTPGIPQVSEAINETQTKQLFERITTEIAKIFVGQNELVLGTLTALFSSGHVLIESVPGLGKTLFVRTLGKVLGCDFGRIQFTADLMPSDITGAPVFDLKTQDFNFRRGPVFTQLLLADEINRSPAKTHAALLEIMQEFRVTVDGKSHDLDRPFLVMATQNPIESEGTYNLPEAQLDRFMFKLVADYPNEAEEARILDLHSRQVDINQQLDEQVETVASPEQILQITRDNANVRIDPRLLDYINKVVRLTRDWPQFHMGASPRAGIALVQGARTLASFHGRDYAVPDDVVQIALPALRHRVSLTAEAEVEGHDVDQLLSELIRSIEVPRI